MTGGSTIVANSENGQSGASVIDNLNDKISRLGISGEMPFFRGSESENVQKFFRRFERHAEFLRWSADDILKAAKLSMRDGAEEFILNRPDIDELTTFSAFKKAIIEHFSREVDKSTLYSNLTNTKQGESTVTEFNSKLEKAAQMLRIHCAELPSDALNNMHLSCFIAGLEPEISKLVTLKGPAKISDAFKVALQMESLINANKVMFKKKSFSFPINECNTIDKRVHTTENTGQGFTGNQYIAQGPSFNRPSVAHNRENKTCFYCQAFGHFAYECNLKRQHMSQNGGHRYYNTYQGNRFNGQKTQTVYRPSLPASNMGNFNSNPRANFNNNYTHRPNFNDSGSTFRPNFEQLRAHSSHQFNNHYRGQNFQ